MTKIYLIRHAEAEGNIYRRAHGHFDGQVTHMGHAQIECLRVRFKDERIDAVYSSDLARTCTTAAAISGPRELQVHTTPKLREVDIGVWEDMAWGDLEHNEPEMTEIFGSDPAGWQVEGGEKYEQVQSRMAECIAEIGERHDGGAVAVFSHGFAIRSLMCRLLGIPSHETVRNPYCDNSAVALILYDNGALTVEYQGDNSHLSDEISTFARQTWWRKDQRHVKENLRYAAFDNKRDAEFIDAHCGDVRRPSAAIELTAFLGSEPVALLGLDSSDEGIGKIAYYHVKPGQRKKGFTEQLIGHALFEFRRLKKNKAQLEIRPDDPDVELFSKHGFTAVSNSDGMTLLEKIIGARG